MRTPCTTAVVVIAAALAAALCVAAPPARAQWAQTQSLYTQDGVEVSVDPRVFALFAMLNALGYDDESERGAPPLLRPKYSKARANLRQSFGRAGTAVKALSAVIEKNPAPVDAYARAALELGPAPKFDASKGVSPLAAAIAEPLRDWFNEEGGANMLRAVAADAKDEQKQTADAVDKVVHAVAGLVRMGDAQEQLLDDTGGATGRAVVVLNPLDAHGRMLRVQAGGATYVLVGPARGKEDLEARAQAAGVAFARTLVAVTATKVAKPGTIADLYGKLDAPAKSNLVDAGGYASELLACALVRSVKTGAACTASPIETDPTTAPALIELDRRVKVYAADTMLLPDAAPTLLAALPPPPEAAPPAPVEAPKKKGGRK